MLANGILFGRPGSQESLDFMQLRRSDASDQLSFGSFNIFSATYSFGAGNSQIGENDDGGEVSRKRDKGNLWQFLSGIDKDIDMKDGQVENIASLRDKKTLKKTATQSKQDLFFDFCTDLFGIEEKRKNKFIDRALVVAADLPNGLD